MTEHGWERDDWPAIFEQVSAAHILVLCTPIWLGEKSSICTQIIERLYGNSHILNEAGQYVYYGRVGGCLVTGNEDGVKHCAMNVLYSLQHLGYVVPPQADAGWIGEAGPGPSYLDPGSGGPANDFTNRNTTFMTWNLLHLARMITDAGGIPVHGNQRSQWDAGCRFDFPNPNIDNDQEYSREPLSCGASGTAPAPRLRDAGAIVIGNTNVPAMTIWRSERQICATSDEGGSKISTGRPSGSATTARIPHG